MILDLEDGVAPSTKEVARLQIATAVQKNDIRACKYVRVNRVGSDWFESDLEATIHRGLDGVCIPKVESVQEVADASNRLGSIERSRGMQVGTVRLLLAIESARGIVRAPELAAASSRVAGLMLGAEDYALDVGLSLHRENEARELLYARSAIVIAARSANVGAIDGVYPDFADLEGLRLDAAQAHRLGFDGKALFHPGQIEEINRSFAPTERDIQYAHEVVEAFEAAVDRGDGAVAVGGQLIDLPIVKRAQAILGLPVT